LHLFQLAPYYDCKVALAIAEHNGCEIAVGLGSKSEFQAAALKAIFECLPNMANFLATGQYRPTQISKYIIPGRPRKRTSHPCRIETSLILPPYKCPFVVARSYSSDLQNFLGEAWEEKELNLKRLGMQLPSDVKLEVGKGVL
jgi:hypothetical protein